MTGLARSILVVGMLLVILLGPGATAAFAQFAPGQKVDYRSATTWEQGGTVVREVPGGRQVIIREKPTQFFPNGPERAYFLQDLRPAQAARAPAPAQPPVNPAAPKVGAGPPAQPAAGPPGPGGLKPGDTIEYKVSNFPEKWERGTIVRLAPNGKQWIIKGQPAQFFPEGIQQAFALEDVRAPQQAAAAPANQTPPAVVPNPAVPPAANPPGGPVPNAPGVLGENDVLAYAKAVMGPNPFADPAHRERALAQIRDYIKQHGVNFAETLEFDNKMHAQGTSSVHNSFAMGANYGAAPRLTDYFGTFDLTSAARGKDDKQRRLGGITINPNGTYSWDTHGDGKAVIQGTWRQAAAGEMQEWEGGPAIWLKDGPQGQEYMVRVNRTPGFEGQTWIDVGMGKGRQAIHYGKKVG